MSSSPGSRRARAPRPAAVLFLFVMLFGALGACTDILGISDRQLTSSGAGGSGATTGNGGNGGDSGACKSDADCAGSKYGSVCDLASQRCVECLPLPAANTCSLGLYCDVIKLCVIGCAADADCNPQGTGPLTCDTSTHQCKGCSGSQPCPPGSKCELATGACVPGCDQSSECPNADWACCLKQCKNVTKDVTNCGDCEEPCVPSDSTSWICLDGGCVFQSCANGWADCDQNLAKFNGCETNILVDPLHCGDCVTKCDLPNAIEGCANGVCNIQGCETGFADCDQKVKTGCETDTTSSIAHCGGCGQPCSSFQNGVAECQNSACVLVGCNSGFGDCDGDPDNGCETNTKTNAQNCGACDNVCDLPNAASTCAFGQCAVAECDPGFADCNGQASDGCEAHLATSAAHCGACGKPCAFQNAAGVCNGGTCEMGPCAEGFENCNGLASDGCETNTNTDEENCGGCGVECAAINGAPTCQAGACQFTCNVGFSNCDGLPANGCEVNVTNSVLNCGECWTACPANGGTPYCFMSQCGVSNCAPGTANCDGNPANGCETDITAPQNCGACGNTCSSTNAVPSCNGSTCSLTCNPGFGNCNNLVQDGCEQALLTNQHCTACNTPCMRPHAITSCGTGACLIVSCETGWADCNNNPSDGCETNIHTSAGNCGGCGIQCAPPNAVGLCVAGACTIGSCNAPFQNCNGGVLDGCEANTNASPDHCGGCGVTCNLPNATSQCIAGGCQVQSCTGSFQNCDGLHPNGCEANTQTSVNHCGACGNQCSNNNGTPTCGGGQCGINCNPGFKNCNGNAGDGCETNVTTTQNCGDCGVPCAFPNASASCPMGVCTMGACTGGFTNCDNMPANGCECGGMCQNNVCQGCGDNQCVDPETCASCPGDCCSGAGGAGGSGGSGAGGAGGSGGGSGGGGSGGGGSGAGASGGSGGTSSGGGGSGGSTTSSSTTTTTSSSTTTTTSTSSSTMSGPCGPFPGVHCSPFPCMPGLGCCRPNLNPASCGMPTTCMQPGDKFFACDDPTDCGAGQVCCHTVGSGSFCTSPALCNGGNQMQLCSSPTAGAPSCECTGGQQCCPTGNKNSQYSTCQPSGDVCL